MDRGPDGPQQIFKSRFRDFRALAASCNSNTIWRVRDECKRGAPAIGAVNEVMTLVVLPLSGLHARGPYELHDLILGLVTHMIVIGLPISFSVRRFAK